MSMPFFLRICVFISAITFTTCTTVNKEFSVKPNTNLSTLSNKAKSIHFLNSFNDSSEVESGLISNANFIHHNLSIADGKSAYLEKMSNFVKENGNIEIIRSFSDGPFVAIQSKYTSDKGSKIVFDVFRFEGEYIVEYWNNSEAVKPPNPSGRSQIDGYMDIEDLGKTDLNKKIVSDYLTTLLIDKDLVKAEIFWDGNNYIQHNTNVSDGANSIKDLIKRFQRDGTKVGYKKIHKLIGEGNFVLAMNEGFYENSSFAYFDLLRIKNGKIAEHWDVIELIPEPHLWKNKQGKF